MRPWLIGGAVLGLLASGWIATQTPHPLAYQPLAPGALHVLLLGHPEITATTLWLRASARIAEAPPDPRLDRELFEAVIKIGDVDPEWDEPWRSGALLLLERGATRQAQLLLETAVDRFPDQSWFPFQLGMSVLRHDQDRVLAADWVSWAASRPDAPDWYDDVAGAIERGR